MSLVLRMNAAVESDLTAHLTKCSGDFVPRLGSRVDIAEYARKIAEHAVRFEAWDMELVGLIAAYSNIVEHSAFITNVSVLRSYRNQGIASRLLKQCLMCCAAEGIRRVALDVDTDNAGAISLYRAHGFDVVTKQGRTMNLILNLGVET